tara:strand:- start:7510 stop:8529 length:1020 start_codon:yes stop_codon:yes gene_type:complete
MEKKYTFATFLTLGISCFITSLSNAELVDGLVEYWEFDGNFTAGLDETNDGVLVETGAGKASFVAGKFGFAVDLENSGGAGNQAIINVGEPAEFAFEAGSMSVSAWYTTESLYTGWNTLISQGEGNNWRIARHGSSDSNLKYSVGGPGNVPANLDQQDGSWHHVAVTHDSTGNITMYIDGVEAASQGAWILANGSGLSLQIGGNPQAANRGWDGNIDDVALWDRALTTEEVALIWNDGAGASVASLTATGSSGLFQVVDVKYSRTEDNILVDLTFTSKEGALYSIFATNDLSLPFSSWFELDDGAPAAVGESTTVYPVDFNNEGLPLDDRQFFVVVKTP